MDYLILEGSHYEIGRQKAEFDGDYLEQVLKRCLDTQRDPKFEQWLTETAIPYTEKAWPHLAEEIEGYLDESGYDRLMAYKYYYSQVRARFTCSNIAVKTEDAGFVFAKNTDLNHFEFPWIFFYHYRPQDGFEFFGYAYRASLTVQGMNAAGLCNGGTSVSGAKETASTAPAVGSPAAFVHRHNIQFAGTVDEVVSNLRDYPTFDKGAGLIYLDATGACRHVNRNQSIFDVKIVEELPAFGVGFFDMDRYEFREDYLPYLQASRARLAYAQEFFMGKGRIRLDNVMEFLRSHGSDWSRPGQWCRHYPQDPHHRTCVSHICIPAQERVLYCHGNPCETPYKEFAFAS